MEKDIAIRVKNVSKSFVIPHEKIDSIRGAFVNMLKRKSYEKFKALDNVSFEVKKGEFFGIIGRNGSGKSTLLKILANIYETDKGKVEIDGMISPFLELGIGFNPDLSGRDNIYLNASVLGLSRKEIDEKFDSIVKFSELERFIDQKLKNYSSGMQVRLAFSVSIHANRDILLMDEVLAVGDNNFQSKCLEEFNKYKELGKTVLLVTHDIDTVQKYCDRALLLRGGQVEMLGDPEEVGNKYIYQNMTDQEDSIFKEQKEKAKKIEKQKKTGNGKNTIISGVRLLDNKGKERNVFETDDDINIEIKLDSRQKNTALNIGVGFYSDDGIYFFGYNTQMDNYTISADASTVLLKIKKISMLKGKYYLNVICFGKIEQDYYDYKPKIKFFDIYSVGTSNKYRGYLKLDHKWE